jgi:hypothetical protein
MSPPLDLGAIVGQPLCEALTDFRHLSAEEFCARHELEPSPE